MWFIRFDATPRCDARTARHAAGAVVNCWVDQPTLHEAVEIAREGIRAEGWIVDEYHDAYEVDQTTYPPGKIGREFFEQALIDKEVFVFYAFPEDPEA
jgi:hypothetical protein